LKNGVPSFFEGEYWFFRIFSLDRILSWNKNFDNFKRWFQNEGSSFSEGDCRFCRIFHLTKGNRNVDFFYFSYLIEFSVGTEISSENDENSIILNVESKMGYLHSPKGNVDFFDFSHLTKFSLGTKFFLKIVKIW